MGGAAQWRLLDLRIPDMRPEMGQLVAVRVDPPLGSSAKPRFFAGSFFVDRRKWWFDDGGNVRDPRQWRGTLNDIWWCPLPEEI